MIMRSVVAAFFLVASTLGGANAQAGRSCYGCNIVDNGDFGRQLVGRTVHGDSWGALTVVDVRSSDKAVRATNSAGVTKWYNG